MPSRLRTLLVDLSQGALSWERQRDQSLTRLGEVLHHLLRDGHHGPYAALPIERKRRTDQLIVDARDHARIVDAGHRVTHFLRQSSADILEFEVPSRCRASIGELQGFIDTLDARGLIPNRGFVYVPWRARPLEILYVGRAKGSERLSLRRHGSLANALSEATSLSLLVPPQSSQEALIEIEASVIEIVGTQMSWPRHNQKRETPPLHDGSRAVDRVAQLLHDVADRLA